MKNRETAKCRSCFHQAYPATPSNDVKVDILCTSCLIHLPIENFASNQKKMKNRETARCRSCCNPPTSNDAKADILCTDRLNHLPVNSLSKNQKKNRASARCISCISSACCGVDEKLCGDEVDLIMISSK
jgi:hypothetical protein